ncbi:uncharacterized protein F4822DRAFT_301109 [Hypoxylon trugodes]|uniref:uncharacterized protein n=1 Tax=Hypoxylon trugodes TaxID=326681 RepID=UPI002196D1D5|nr:uncharacterized protein F4822DRAFT_301109 [Hypoxylon trugodes]KAI1388056.1 hypothetical protein F4822DRAFT_301109 [Hypoxylon trugodes]
MAIRWLLSLVYLSATLTVAREYSYSDADLLDATITKSVTETVTKYLSECGNTQVPDTTLPDTTTFTSTLQSTVSIIIPASVTDVSGVAPIGLNPSQSGFNFTNVTLSPTPSVLGTGIPTGLNHSTLANITKVPCSTATVIVTGPLSSSGHSGTLTSPVQTTSSIAPASVSPTQVPISESYKSGHVTAMQILLGVAGILSVFVAGFL